MQETGFRLDDRTWPSLSAIARHITGTTWSGPRFFGLTVTGQVARDEEDPLRDLHPQELRRGVWNRSSTRSMPSGRPAPPTSPARRPRAGCLLPTHYDDGGISGGTLERPAMQQLLADIDAGRVDQIVVYKIDRLTRSLADFAKIVERLDCGREPPSSR